jgi:hypothetical protein
MSNFLEIATAMAQRGVAVTPTYAGLRYPAKPKWDGDPATDYYAATTDMKRIEAWARENPNFNCCCISKFDGKYSLDIDDLAKARERGMPDLPHTFMVDTPGGGLHVYLTHNALSRTLGNANVYEREEEREDDPETGKKKPRKKIVEVKGNNASVCAPGCTRDDGGIYKIRPGTENLPFAKMTLEFYEWVVREGEIKKSKSVTGGKRKYHPDFDRDDLHEHFDWTFAVDEPYVQSDGAEYLTFEACPVCDHDLDQDDVAGRKCCLIYGKYGVSFNCVWCGESTRWEELMEAMEEKGYERYPEPIFLDQDIELMLSNPAFPVETDDLPETVALTDIFTKATEVEPHEELAEVLSQLPNEQREDVQAAWKMAAEGLFEIRKGIEVYKDENGKTKTRQKFRHQIDDEVLACVYKTLKDVMSGKFFVDAYPYIFLPKENRVYKFHDDEAVYRLLTRFGLRRTQHDYKLTDENLHHEILMYGAATHIEKFGCMRGEAIYVNNGKNNIIKITQDAIVEVPNGTDDVYMLNKHLTPWPTLDKARMDEIAARLGGYGGKVTASSNLCEHLNAFFDEGKLSPEQYQQLVIMRYLSLFLGTSIDLRPILIALGVQNSGKSTLWEKFMWLFYGTKFESGGLPTNLRSFIAAITNHQVMLFDNIDSANFENTKSEYPTYIDLMCKCSTGGKIKIAQLYENNVEKDYDLRCDLFLTSRTNPFPSHRSDLLRRMQIFPIRKPEKYKRTEIMKRELAAATDAIKLETLVRLQLVLKALIANRDREYDPVSEMHSYESFTMRVADFEGWAPEMKTIWQGYYEEYQQRATEDSPLINIVRCWVGKEGNVGRKVRTGQIYQELEDQYGRTFTQNYRTNAAFGRRLKENFSALGLLGIKKMFLDGGTTYWFEPNSEQLGVCKHAYEDSRSKWAREADEQPDADVIGS